MLQVVHHPTVIAAHGEGASWTFAGDCEVRSKFWGRSIELIPVGLIRLKFDDGDEYTWQKVSPTQTTLETWHWTLCMLLQSTGIIGTCAALHLMLLGQGNTNVRSVLFRHCRRPWGYSSLKRSSHGC